MTWYLWFLAAYFLVTAVITVGWIGRPREPIAPDAAAAVVLINAFLIAGIFLFGGRP